MSKPKLLWISDAAVPTGFARVTHNVLGWLGGGWQRCVIGVNATGDPHSYPYPIYPARVGGDIFGFGRFAEIVNREKPDVIVVGSDAWIVATFIEIAETIPDCPPLCAYMPVDALGMKRATAEQISKLALAIFFTDFGLKQASSAGFHGVATVIGCGVRHEIYKPIPRREARSYMAPEIRDAFIFGNVNRNAPRKRLDLTISYFAEYVKRGGDGYLYLHCCNEDVGWDLQELAAWYGIADRLYMPPAATLLDLPPEEVMPRVYSSLDVQLTTTQSEGQGLCHLEGMACGVPQIMPEFAALAEWPRGAVRYVPASDSQAHIGFSGFGVGAIPAKEPFVEAMFEFRRDAAYRRSLSQAGLALTSEPRFEWSHSAALFDQALSAVLAGKSRKAA